MATNLPKPPTAPPSNRANLKMVAVRLHGGALIAHIADELGEQLVREGVAKSFRHGERRYLRLIGGIAIERLDSGWDVMEFLRKWHGDKRAAGYVAHKDGLSERVSTGPPKRSNGGAL